MSYEYQDRYNPNEYGEKKRAAMRHARDLKQEREYYGGVHDGDREYTFQPKVNKRPAYLDKGPSAYRDLERERARERDREYIRQKTENYRRTNHYDERDRDYSQHAPKFSQYSSDRHSDMERVRRQMMSDDAMERPLAATLKNLKIDGASAPTATEEQQSYSVGTYTRPRYKDRFDASPTNLTKVPKSKLGLKISEPQPSHHSIRHQFENFDINSADPTSNYLSTLRESPDKRGFVGGEWNHSSVVERVDVFNSRRKSKGKRSSDQTVGNRYDSDMYTPPHWSDTREAHIRALSNRGKGLPEPMTDEIDDELTDHYYHQYPYQQSYQGERVVGKGGMKGNADGAKDRLKLLKKKIKPIPPKPPALSPVKRAYGASKNSPPKAKSPLQERQLKRKEMRAHISSIRTITPEEEEDLGYQPLYQAEPIVFSSTKKQPSEISPARNLMGAMDATEIPQEKKEAEEKSVISRENELSTVREETKKVKIVRRESHGDVESEEDEDEIVEKEEDYDDQKSDNEDDDNYNDPLDDFEDEDDKGNDDDDDGDDSKDILKKNKRLQNNIKKRHQKGDKYSLKSEVGNVQEFSPIHKLHDYSEPHPEDIDYVPLYVAGPILTKKQLELLKKDTQLEKEHEQSTWRHNHDVSDDKRVGYSDDNSSNAGRSSTSKMDDGNKQYKDTQDLPDMIGRDALPRTPAAGSKFVEPEVGEFDVKRLYMEPFSPLPEPQVIGRSKDEDEINNVGPRKPEGPHHSPREVLYQPGEDPAEAPPKIPAPAHECPHCHRTFNEAPYRRHIQICKDVFGRKKTAYSSTDNHLLQDATGEKLKHTKKVFYSDSSADNSSTKKDKWKKDSSELRTAMKEGRKIQRAIEKGGPMPDFVPSKPDDSFVQCPHCERKFNKHAAARHIPQCKNIIAKPSTLKRGAGLGGGIAGAPVSKKALGGMR